MKFVLAAVCLMAASTWADLPASCEYKGVTYEHGARFNDDCNSCGCVNGLALCTQKACKRSAGSCEYNGQLYENGAAIDPEDGCNMCGCLNGNVACTGALCKRSSGSSKRSASADCVGFGGEYHFPGDDPYLGKDGCNMCSCLSDGVEMCTYALCQETCTNGVVTVNVGEDFTAADGCNDCVCTPRGPMCTKLYCGSRK